jgi:hypothetical protein
MATFSFGTGIVPGAPGTYINERVGNVASAGIAPFNTTYLLVETEENVPTTRFPFNKPVPVSSLSDYKILVGRVPETRIPLLSYNCINAFFSNAQVGDLRVVRVGTPNQIAEIEILPSGSKISNSGLPSSLQAGDVVYAQLVLNGLKLVAGDGSTGYTSEGEWLGVPAVIPVDYVSGDEVNNRKISAAISSAIAAAIESNPSVRSAIYVRDSGLVNDLLPSSNSESGYITIAASTYDGSVSVVTEQLPVGAEYVLMQNTYEVQNIVGLQNNLERVPQDYIQCINTAFDGQVNQGYLATPTAYAQFDAEGRAAVGAAAASHCQDNNFKWMAVADPGPFLVSDINKYKEYTPHQPANDLVTDNLYLVDNAIYKWAGNDVTYDRLKYQTLVSGYDPRVAIESSVEGVAEDEKVGLLDLAKYIVTSTSPLAQRGVFLLDSNTTWPVDLQIQQVTLSSLGADFLPLLPVGETSVEVYFVAPPFNSALYGPYPSDGSDQFVYIAQTAAEAVSILTEVTALGGTALALTAALTPTGAFSDASPTTSTAAATYTTPQWNLPVTIEGQTSNLIRNLTGDSTFVNTLHLPGSLQEPTEEYRLAFVSRSLFNPSIVLSSSTVSGYTGAASFGVSSHKLVNGQKLYFTKPILANSTTLFKATVKNNLQEYYVKVIDNDNFVLATSSSNYLSGSYVPYPTGMVSISTSPTILYSSVRGGGLASVNLSELSIVPLIRGRKYGLASGTIWDRAYDHNLLTSNDDPTVSLYLNTSSLVLGSERIFPYGETNNAGWLPSLELVTPGSTSTSVDNFLCTPTVDQSFSSEAYLVPVINPIFGGNFEAGTTAVLGILDSITPYATACGLDVGDTGVTIQSFLSTLSGVYFTVTSAPANSVAPDGTTEVVVGDRIAVVFNGSSYVWVVVPADSLGGDMSTVSTICYGSQVEFALTPEQTPAANLWRFDAVTATEIIDEALRGVGFAGEPQAVFVDAGVDNVNRLYEDSQRYFNAFGFIAFYGPYVENSAGQFIPPTPYVTGVATRRYRSEGFQFPPAGTKYQLSDAAGVQIAVNSAQQNLLNPDGCNVLRSLPGYPDTAVFIWGGRTRINKAVADQRKFQFVNTRVIQNVVYGSLRNAFDNQIFSVVDGFGIVFNQIVSIGNSVLSQLYLAGALFGARPSDAFQVICDERINSGENLENGVVFVKVFDTPVPTLERIEVDLIRVSVGQMNRELESQGLG